MSTARKGYPARTDATRTAQAKQESKARRAARTLKGYAPRTPIAMLEAELHDVEVSA